MSLDTDIAVIGMAIRCPGADDLDKFWENIRNGVESVSSFTDEELESPTLWPVDIKDPYFVNRGFILEDIDLFDADFFGIPPSEAELMDPQHRLFLECVWQAMENSGYNLTTYPEPVALYAGSGLNTYLFSSLLNAKSPLQSYRSLIGNEKDYLATRISYKLNFSGESINVQTACSTSLVAVHLACQSLMTGQSNVAIAGGVHIQIPQKTGYVYQQDIILSPDGHCRAFDKEAQGTVFGNGMGVVVLKLLSQAISDHDHIYAVIKGSATNNDGSTKVSYTAPSIEAQASVIAVALEFAGISADTISYVETHGTGTYIGDPIEIEALQQAFQEHTTRKGYCAIGSVKTNIGHLNTAAGIVGLIKTVLALHHKEIPPSLNFKEPNPRIDFNNSPFFVNTILLEWKQDHYPRRAGVSSFGIGGTNVHVVLEEAPAHCLNQNIPERPRHILALSAKNQTALRKLTEGYCNFIAKNPNVSLANCCFTAATGRDHFDHRLVFTANSTEHLHRSLEFFCNGKKSVNTILVGDKLASTPPRLAFMFTGQGSEYVGMCRQLYETQPTFCKVLNKCEEIISSYLEVSVFNYLYNDQAFRLHETWITQPILFAIEYALAQLWLSWGIEIDILLGHSLGEYVAACIAGVFDLEDGLKLVTKRGHLIHNLPSEGRMAVVFAPKEQVDNFLQSYRDHVSIAAINGPAHTVISGLRNPVTELLHAFEEKGFVTQTLPIPYGFHSPLMDPILDEFERIAQSIHFKKPKIPFISNLTGQIMTEGQIPDATYWRNHLREPVQFAAGLMSAAEHGNHTFLEIGPQPTLIKIGQRILLDKANLWLPSVQPYQDDWETMLESLGKLYIHGARLNWNIFDGDYQRYRIPLPTYPFERKRYWIKSTTDDLISNKIILPDKKSVESIGKIKMEQITTVSQSPRKQSILSTLQTIIGDLLKVETEKVDIHAPFIEMGADSLVLIQTLQIIHNTYGIRLSIREFFEGLTNIDALATYLDQTLPIEFSKDTHHKKISSDSFTIPIDIEDGNVLPLIDTKPVNEVEVSDTALERIIQQQLEIMSKQLDLVSNRSLSLHQSSASKIESHFSLAQGEQLNKPPLPQIKDPKQECLAPVVPYQPIDKRLSEGLSAVQHDHLRTLIENYTKRTPGSKHLAQSYRHVLADNRNSAGFRYSIKEMLYPIVAERASGSRIWDVDGNEYIDLAMGFGVHLFGHSPAFITEALQQQIDRGIPISPQSTLAGEVATLIHDLTGMERVAFCNSGTEAVMLALRLARTTTRRSKIVLFAGSYHGTFDGILARSTTINETMYSLPLTLGITQSMVEDVVVLEYGSSKSLDFLKGQIHEIAAVLVEPVQSRRPDLQPHEFLHHLQRLTSAGGAALIFDEIITGFRIHQGGAQAWFGIKADLVTYGKVIGGGLPIGVVAGKASFMDTIDGGFWNYGDTSYPQVDTTFFAGTFSKHVLTMAAARAVLKHLKINGTSIQNELNQRTQILVDTLNTYFQEENIPIKIVYFGSLFRFSFSCNMDLFFYHLINKGIYISEGRNCFLSTAHTQDDISYIIQAIKESIEEMKNGGFLATDVSSVPVPSINELSTSSIKNSNSPPSLDYQESIPITEAQRPIWFLAQMKDEASIAYNQSTILRIRGPINVVQMRQVIQIIINRHDALRTVFSIDGEYQRVIPQVNIDIPLVDFSHLTEDIETKVREWIINEGRQIFNLAVGPLIRAHILRLDTEHHLLIIIVHHIIADGWSIGVLLQELEAIYSALINGKTFQLPTPVQFKEYAVWWENFKQSPELARMKNYWLSQFSDQIPILNLPADRTRPVILTYKGAREVMTIDFRLCTDLKRISTQHGCTIVMTLLAAFEMLLHRLTGQNDVVIGIATANRAVSGYDSMIGHCVNLLALRRKIDSNPTFSDLLAVVKTSLLNTYEHQDYPFNTLVEQINPPRDLSRLPIVTVVFNMDRSLILPKMPNLEIEPVPFPISYAQFELSLNVTDLSNTLRFEFDYNTDLFEAQTIQRWMGHFENLLRAVTIQPLSRLSNLSLLTADEQNKILNLWKDTETYFPKDKCLHEIFEEQVKKKPNDVAILFEEKKLTFDDLNRQANQLAHYLKKLGVGPEVVVGLSIERSQEAIIGILGILKAGGAYLPLDPAYPSERLTFMLKDAKVSVLLTIKSWEIILPDHECQIVYLDTDWQAISQEDESNPISEVTSENLLYVIYTSGSTGLPKGVMGFHKATLCRLYWIWETYPFEQQEICCQRASMNFIDSVGEIFGPLLQGVPIVIIPDAVALDLEKFINTLSANHVTRIVLVPSLLRAILDTNLELQNKLPDLKFWLTGGETLSVELLQQFRDVMSMSKLFNSYGSTEMSDNIFFYETSQKDKSLRFVPIGYDPVGNTRIYILDSYLNPVPIGVPGELYVSSEGLTRGYLNRPKLTAEKYIPDPFSTKLGSRLYWTGDLVRYWPDGSVEFLGRKDNQVKIRGMRVELGEIESVLNTHPGIKQVVVIAREDTPDEKQLAAYYVPYQEFILTVQNLRSFVKQKLPNYMMPSIFVELDTLPLNPNGKVDRKVLPSPDASQRQNNLYVAPRTPTEIRLAEIWSSLLDLEQVGIYNDFFELGGHSLMATQVVSRVRKAFQIEFPLRYLFESPTVAELALKITQLQIEEEDQEDMLRLLEELEQAD